MFASSLGRQHLLQGGSSPPPSPAPCHQQHSCHLLDTCHTPDYALSSELSAEPKENSMLLSLWTQNSETQRADESNYTASDCQTGTLHLETVGSSPCIPVWMAGASFSLCSADMCKNDAARRQERKNTIETLFGKVCVHSLFG